MTRWLISTSLIALSAAAQAAGIIGGGVFKPSVTVAAGPMQTPIFLAGGSAAPSNVTTTVNYAYMIGTAASSNWTATAANRGNPASVTGIIQGLEAYFPTGSGTGTWTVNFFNVSAQAVTCTVPTSSTLCSDRNVHTSSISSGGPDVIYWQTNPNNSTPTAQTNQVQVAAILKENSGYSTIFGGAAGNMSTANGTPNYASFGQINTAWTSNTIETAVSVVMPTSGNLDNLCTVLNAAPGASANYTFTLFVNQVATGLTNVISGASATKLCTLGTPVHVSAGDTISVQSQASATAPTARSASVSIRWLPDNAGEAVVFDTPLPPSPSSTRFYLVSGLGAAGTTAVDETNIIPYTAVAQHYKKLTVAYCKTTGTAIQGRTTIMEAGAFGSTAATGLTTLINDNFTSACPTAGNPFSLAGAFPNTLVQDTTNVYDTSAPVTDGTGIDIKTTVTATLSALAQYKISAVVVVGP